MKLKQSARKLVSTSSRSSVSRRRLLLPLLIKRLLPVVVFILCLSSLVVTYRQLQEPPDQSWILRSGLLRQCDFIPPTDEFISAYNPRVLVGVKPDPTRVEPSIERLRSLLEKTRSQEDQHQPLLETFDVFSMINPNASFKPYAYGSNTEQMKLLYHQYIKLQPDNKSVAVDGAFIDYLRKISGYLSDGLKHQRTSLFPVRCSRRPVFVLACDDAFFGGLQGAIHTLDTYWPDHQIIVYDMGHTQEQKQLLKRKCRRCMVIQFPFSAIEKVAPHIRTLKNYAFKPFVVQDALRRYGQIIYGDSSARFTTASFDAVLYDNYIRGFAVRELPGHRLSCYTRSGAFAWFNQSYANYDDIYMSEANFLVVTDTFLTRLIMKAWLTCALDTACLIAENTPTLCEKRSGDMHRYDQSAMVIILTHFFFQGERSGWSNGAANAPAAYDMFTSVQEHLGDIMRGSAENYLVQKEDE